MKRVTAAMLKKAAMQRYSFSQRTDGQHQQNWRVLGHPRLDRVSVTTADLSKARWFWQVDGDDRNMTHSASVAAARLNKLPTVTPEEAAALDKLPLEWTSIARIIPLIGGSDAADPIDLEARHFLTTDTARSRALLMLMRLQPRGLVEQRWSRKIGERYRRTKQQFRVQESKA